MLTTEFYTIINIRTNDSFRNPLSSVHRKTGDESCLSCYLAKADERGKSVLFTHP